MGSAFFIDGKRVAVDSLPEFHVWIRIQQRCCNPKTTGYHRYGGRGITVCERWLNSFAAFFEDMGRRPSPRHSIDRIDNNGNYEPGNCRWATPKQQTRNRQGNRFLEAFGLRLTVAEWAERVGLKSRAILHRIDRRGWSIERALTVSPIDPKRLSDEEVRSLRRRAAEGGWGIITQLAKETGMGKATVSQIVNRKTYAEVSD